MKGKYFFVGLFSILSIIANIFLPVGDFGAPGAEILQRYFLTEIQPLLFPLNDFFGRSRIDDAFVNNNTVELPHSGTIPTVAVNRASLPALIAKRADLATNYTLEELTTDPTVIQDSEGYIVAYNKRASVLELHAMAINDKAAIRALYAWVTGLTNANFGVIPTTSATLRNSSAPGSTKVSCKAIAKADFISAKILLDSQNVPQDNRLVVLNAQFYGDLLAIPEFSYFQYYGNVVLPSGVLQRAIGFDIYLRAITPVYTWVSGVSQTVKAEGAAVIAATDVASATFYHQNFVRRAKGSVKAYVDPDRADYYGSLFSMMVRWGGTQTRIDLKGLCSVVETS